MKKSLLLITALNIISLISVGLFIVYSGNSPVEQKYFYILLYIAATNGITAKVLLQILKENF